MNFEVSLCACLARLNHALNIDSIERI
jgi:hypothetical protein